MRTNLLKRLSDMSDREDIPDVLNEFGMVGHAAEVGVLWGAFSAHVLRKWNGEKYYCVDPWEHQSQEEYREFNENTDYDQCFRQVSQLAESDQRIVILKGLSTEMVKDVPKCSLDWVFIDGNHTYKNVLEDMELWFNRLKIGGILSGHDYLHKPEYPACCEVKPAVDRWMKDHNIQFVIDKGSLPSWWAIKP